MKKFLIAIAAGAILLSSASAQILKERSVQNTLYTGFGLPYEDDNDDGHDSFKWFGLLDTLQVRLDWEWFTIDGGLSWGLPLYDWHGSGIRFENTHETQFAFLGEQRGGKAETACKDGYKHYVNFVVRPFNGFEAGVGTHLDWSVGPSPQTGGFPWMPISHVLQGDLSIESDPKESNAPVENEVRGKFDYAYKWADAAIAARYTIGFDKAKNHYLQLGVAIPDATTSGHFFINAAAELKPIDLLTVAVAYKHADSANGGGDFYTGLKLDFTRNFNIEAWFGLDGIGLKKSGDVDGHKMWGTGAAVYIKFGKLPLWIKPEVGFSDYLYSDYTAALYTGGRIQWDITKALHLGAWTSFAWGAKIDDPSWDDYNRGFIWNIRPDFTFDINQHHSISAVFEYETTHYPNDNRYNRFCFGFYWKYNRAF
ncbi:MAG: hypothetical protein K2I95_01805 [Treponemataceae bacterium]|nr:hypothetical protein [Treponemataceae bacterium]